MQNQLEWFRLAVVKIAGFVGFGEIFFRKTRIVVDSVSLRFKKSEMTHHGIQGLSRWGELLPQALVEEAPVERKGPAGHTRRGGDIKPFRAFSSRSDVVGYFDIIKPFQATNAVSDGFVGTAAENGDSSLPRVGNTFLISMAGNNRKD